MRMILTDNITLREVIEWIKKTQCLHSLQKIRAKTNKRIKEFPIQPKESTPFDNLTIEERREILKPILIEKV